MINIFTILVWDFIAESMFRLLDIEMSTTEIYSSAPQEPITFVEARFEKN